MRITQELRGANQRGGAAREASRERERSSAAPVELGNLTNRFSRENFRAHRWAMRDILNDVSSLPRVRKCGRVPIAPNVSLKSGGGTSHSGYGGLALCGSVWACPVCSGKIAAHRKNELSSVAEKAIAGGGFVSMLTLTQRHHKGQSLAELWEALSFAWNRVTSGRRWLEFKRQLGLIGYVKAVEVTHGKNGWHVHVHVLVISEKDPAVTPVFWQRKQGRAKRPYPPEIMMPASFIADRWKAGLSAKNVDFVAHLGGLDWQTAGKDDAGVVGRYVAKMGGGIVDGIAAEATLGAFKKAKRGNRTPFQILEDFIDTGDMDDLALWHQWESVSHGKRALTWSQGLRDWAGLNAEKTDEEIAEEDAGGEVVALFDRDAWKQVRKHGPVELLDVLDAHGKEAAYEWLSTRGIMYVVPAWNDDVTLAGQPPG